MSKQKSSADKVVYEIDCVEDDAKKAKKAMEQHKKEDYKEATQIANRREFLRKRRK